MLLSVQVDATGPLLNGHDWEADVDAAMKFAFLDLRQVADIYFWVYATVYSRLQLVKSLIVVITFTTNFFHTIKSEETNESSLLLITMFQFSDLYQVKFV